MIVYLVYFIFFLFLHFNRFPFDVRTPIGYTGCCLIQVIAIVVLSSLYIVIISFMIGLCVFDTAFVSDIEEKLRQLNAKLIKADEKMSQIYEKLEMEKIFIDVIKFHSVAKSLSLFVY